MSFELRSKRIIVTGEREMDSVLNSPYICQLSLSPPPRQRLSITNRGYYLGIVLTPVAHTNVGGLT